MKYKSHRVKPIAYPWLPLLCRGSGVVAGGPAAALGGAALLLGVLVLGVLGLCGVLVGGLVALALGFLAVLALLSSVLGLRRAVAVGAVASCGDAGLVAGGGASADNQADGRGCGARALGLELSPVKNG